ncbi:hypothetical protein Hanom_Chr15g01369601 [Helianthus anomalus]
MTIKNEYECLQKTASRGPGFSELHSCLRDMRARTSSTKFQFRNSFFAPPCARVVLVVKHVIKL